MNPMLDYVNSLSIDELKEFLAEIRGDKPNESKRDITDISEKEKTLTMLRLLTPSSSSNNQRSWTDTYIIGNQDNYDEYHVTWWPGDELPEITVISKDEENV